MSRAGLTDLWSAVISCVYGVSRHCGRGATATDATEERMAMTTLACGEETGNPTTTRGCEEDLVVAGPVGNPFGEF